MATDRIAPFVRAVSEPRGLGPAKVNLLAEFRKAGIEPSYGGPTIFRIREGLFCLVANHQYNVSAKNHVLPHEVPYREVKKGLDSSATQVAG